MIDRRHIEQVLKLNGLNPNSPDDKIKSLLISARWHEDDVETALVVLRENPKNRKQHIDSVHKIYSSNQKLSPDTLNALLGMDVEVASVTQAHRTELRQAYRRQIFTIGLAATFLTTVVFTLVMWIMKIGFFHS
ncbi:hypothetical protein N8083_00260 [Candidatus Pacebacteria bacterium]|nr:hypothetical protein [Candidatus Paceibacterota bacterium]